MAKRSIRTSASWRTAPVRNKLAQSVTLALLTASIAAPANAVEFNLGEIEGRFDSQLSIGSSWRMSDANSDLISAPNGGTGLGGGSFDDGTQNYAKGDAFSTVFKGVHDLQLSKDNVGIFMRGKYWYDYAQSEGNANHGHIPNGYASNSQLDDSGFNDYAKFSGAEILDAYVFGSFDINDKPLDIRLGRQVVNWGESTFIQGGINVINPFDVSAFRRAGAEIKEGLLPVNMAFASFGLTDNLSVEGFYQLEWEKTVTEGCGTYFSTADISSEGCDGIRVAPTNPLHPLYGLSSLNDQVYYNNFSSRVVFRSNEGIREADDGGQFGLAFRYFAEELNSTEFGLYFAKYHSRLPLISGVNTTSLNPFASQYFIEYPEDTKMVGISFSSNIGDVAWSGEISHKQDVPIQLNGAMLVGAILTGGADPSNPASSRVSAAGAGGEVSGYDMFDVTQVQTTFIKYIDQVMGASRMALIGELGWTHIHDLDENASAIKYGRNSVFGFSNNDTDGFVTQDSFGYVVRANLSYSDVFAGVNLKPEISLKQGIDGNGPEPGAAFREGESSATLSLTADYLNQYQVQLGYTSFFGGDYNAIDDRDYLSLSASASF
ncbi:DUF1302 domain-containing protein [uncultured Amphritea sp.]|uniref:DUF1302 domain-containing protein n=1 Tax=uncultured Amphritea sp. TaxID=981605 RepID=UPI00262C4784|nr:DUF1302 domain-containing protein [uncultured Amphritea sp.]